MAETTLEHLGRFLADETGLVTVATTRAGGGAPLLSVVNAGIIDHPTGANPVVAHVARGDAARLRHLRERPALTLLARRGWDWVAAEGTAELIGPDDPHEGVDGEALRLLLREIFAAAGGSHDDLDEYDRVMRAERRAAVLLSPDRVYTRG